MTVKKKVDKMLSHFVTPPMTTYRIDLFYFFIKNYTMRYSDTSESIDSACHVNDRTCQFQ